MLDMEEDTSKSSYKSGMTVHSDAGWEAEGLKSLELCGGSADDLGCTLLAMLETSLAHDSVNMLLEAILP